MFRRITNGFQLARSSWHVLRTDKHLLVFPIFSGLCCLLILASFVTPFVFHPEWAGIKMDRLAADQPNAVQPPMWFWLVVFAFYFCNYFVVVFFNAALISCALIRFNGEEPTLRDGLGAAGARLPQILAWAFVAATVGVALKALENVHERIGAFISALLGTAWSILTFFVVPVLVVEKVGPFQAIGRSVAILRKTWGEALVGHAGIGLFVFLLALPWLVLFPLGGFLAFQGMIVGWFVLGAAALYFLIWLAIGPALNGIHLGALYQYAAHGEVPRGFERGTMESAFQSK